ncbi:MAG: hypothetical protein RBU37_07930 [Myxococcota bacterium]|jgi:hypothetical protein|nr:hypothetical protein [Myxococcota bacterium]
MKSSVPARERFTRIESLFLLSSVAAMVLAIWTLACTGNAPPPRQPVPLPQPGEQPEEGAEATLDDDSVVDADDDLVLFGVDDAGLEMELPMVPLEELTGQDAVEAVSGSWVVENFIYTPQGLDTVQSNEYPDAVVISMRHRRRDAQILLWTVMESRLDAEQYLDVSAEAWIEKLASSDSLLDAVNGRGGAAPAFEGLAMSQATLAGRPFLQVDAVFEHQTRRKLRQIRLVLHRQQVGDQSVLLALAMNARLEDFASLVAEMRGFSDAMVLLGTDPGLAINPELSLDTVGKQFALLPLTAWNNPAWAKLAERLLSAAGLGRGSAVQAADPLEERDPGERELDDLDDELPEASPPSL